MILDVLDQADSTNELNVPGFDFHGLNYGKLPLTQEAIVEIHRKHRTSIPQMPVAVY